EGYFPRLQRLAVERHRAGDFGPAPAAAAGDREQSEQADQGERADDRNAVSHRVISSRRVVGSGSRPPGAARPEVGPQADRRGWPSSGLIARRQVASAMEADTPRTLPSSSAQVMVLGW